jgi:hypothetical protein
MIIKSIITLIAVGAIVLFSLAFIACTSDAPTPDAEVVELDASTPDAQELDAELPDDDAEPADDAEANRD